MSLETYTIEIRVDFDTKEKHDIAVSAVRSAAKQLLTTVQLISDKRKPDIAITGRDMFEGAREISMFEDGEQENPL